MSRKRNVYLIKPDIQLGMADKKTIGLRIKRLRKLKGLSQEEFADKVENNVASVKRWEKGEFLPNVGTQKMIAEFFTVPMEELFDPELQVDDAMVSRVGKVEKRVEQVEGKVEEISKQMRKLQTPNITDPDDLIIAHALKTLSPENKEKLAQLARVLMKKSQAQLVDVKAVEKKPKPRQP